MKLDFDGAEMLVQQDFIAAEKLSGDIYIESHFDAEYLDNIEYSHTMIMYPEER